MNVLLVSAEAVPFAKVGGMADVVGSLPLALRKLGIDARVILPGYGFIEHDRHNIRHLFTFTFTHRLGTSAVQVYVCVYHGVPFYLVQAWPFFGNDGSVYTEWNWDVPRFIFFNQVVMATLVELQQRLGWLPDVLHVNDWHSGLLPFLLAENRWQPAWTSVATVLSIHNIAYQGDHAGGFLWDAGIPERRYADLVAQHLTDNLLAIAIAYADKVSTVSPRYAIEIQYPYAGYELAGLIQSRAADLHGILNGLDTEIWDPATDDRLVSNYDVEHVDTQRSPNKRHLQSLAHLPIRDEVPIIGMVSRLTQQKGLDMALPALRQLMLDTDAQVVILGTGEADLEYQCWQLGRDFHWKAAAFLQFDAALAQHIYAGSDMFLMPSHFEPCGMGQMMAMRYGSLPVVRETGGLADTVENFDNHEAESGTGFVFQWEEAEAVLGTLRWAIDTYYRRPQAWKRMQKRAMLKDFSWQKSAQAYTNLYRQILAKGRQQRES